MADRPIFKNYDIVITSGGFDPIHKGHIEYLELSAKLGMQHICILNTDDFLKKKKGFCFMPIDQRFSIVQALRCVQQVWISCDTDLTVCETIRAIKRRYPHSSIAFAKGGDRFSSEIPEAQTCAELGIDIIDGLGKKIESSSKIVQRYTEQITC